MAVALRGGEGDAASASDVPVWTGALAGATAIQPQDPSSPGHGAGARSVRSQVRAAATQIARHAEQPATRGRRVRTSLDVHGLEPNGLGRVAVLQLVQSKLVAVGIGGSHCTWVDGGAGGVPGGVTRVGSDHTRMPPQAARLHSGTLCPHVPTSDVLGVFAQEDAGQVAYEHLAFRW